MQRMLKYANVGLDVLWRDVDDLHRLFSFLAPLRRTGAGFVRFNLVTPKSNSSFGRNSRNFRMQIVGKSSSIIAYVCDDWNMTTSGLARGNSARACSMTWRELVSDWTYCQICIPWLGKAR